MTDCVKVIQESYCYKRKNICKLYFERTCIAQRSSSGESKRTTEVWPEKDERGFGAEETFWGRDIDSLRWETEPSCVASVLAGTTSPDDDRRVHEQSH